MKRVNAFQRAPILSSFSLTLPCVALAVLSSCGQSTSLGPVENSALTEAWPNASSPLILDPFIPRYFDESVLTGALKGHTMWSDHYWQSNLAGLAYRWQIPGDDPFRYKTHGLPELKKMSQQQIAKLSPAEKYDIFRGQTELYPLVRSERVRNMPSAPDWSGLCHGLAPASLNFEEPRPVTLRSPDGILVPFGASDIKALLSYYQGEIARARGMTRGSFQGEGEGCGVNGSKCKGVNAGAFHLSLTHAIARLNRGVIVDAKPGKEIWNFPIYQYKASVVRRGLPGRRAGVKEEIEMKLTAYLPKMVVPHWEAQGLTSESIFTMDYRYLLELDNRGFITGGTWLNAQGQPSPDALKPDFLWTKPRPPFANDWEALGRIYEAATGE